MRKILMMGLVSMVLFGASAAGSYFYLQSQQPAIADTEEHATDEPPLTPAVQGGHGGEPHSPAANSTHGDSAHGQGGGDLPVPFEATPMQAETILRLSAALKQREDAVAQREEFARKQEERVKFALDDLQREQTRLKLLQDQIEAQLAKASEWANQATPAETPTNSNTNTTPTATTEQPDKAVMDATALKNLKQTAEWFRGLPPERAAESLKEFANNGGLQKAAELLSLMEDRDVSKILAEMDEVTLINQIVEAVHQLKPKTKQ